MTTTPEQLTFESAYDELQQVLAELEDKDSPPAMARTVELVQRGKSLERGLERFLEDCKGKLERIEAGEGVPEIEILTATGGGNGAATVGDDAGGHEGDVLWTDAEARPRRDDEIPF
jgi:exodeoxyribonuclease VII small subunit